MMRLPAMTSAEYTGFRLALATRRGGSLRRGGMYSNAKLFRIRPHIEGRMSDPEPGSHDSPLERAGFEPSVPGESGFDFAREVRGRLFAGGRWIRTSSTRARAALGFGNGHAHQLGVFGSPTFVMDGELF